MKKYALAMGIRLVCLVFVFIVPDWWKIVPILGAVLIPWFAVIIANAGGDMERVDQSALIEQAPQPSLQDPHRAHGETPSATAATETIIQGEVIEGEDVEDFGDQPAPESKPNETGSADQASAGSHGRNE